MPVTLQEQAKALGDPTRHRLFRYLADANRPVDIAELTDHLGLHHNAIRQHLARLVETELVSDDRAPTAGRGRPRLVYRVNPKAAGRWEHGGPYERLSLLLVEMLRTRDTPIEVGRRSVLDEASSQAEADTDPVAFITHAMDRQGFDPVLRARGKRLELVLQTCPYETVAVVDADTVCAIHLGIAHGLAARTGNAIAIDDLVRRDPRRADCRLRMHLVPAPK